MAGDGELAILPDGVHEPDVLATMLPVLAGWLRRHNRPRRTEHHLRIRVALHNGLIHVNGAAGFPGRSTVLVMRLLASTMLRDAMDSRPDVSVAAMISKRLYQEIVLNGYLGLRPEDFHRAAAEVPAKDFKATAWLYFPEDAASVHG
jgi:hypothetical protein